jgi:hypothetical protein
MLNASAKGITGKIKSCKNSGGYYHARLIHLLVIKTACAKIDAFIDHQIAAGPRPSTIPKKYANGTLTNHMLDATTMKDPRVSPAPFSPPVTAVAQAMIGSLHMTI